MSSLASQLEGDARKMILKDIEGMERIISRTTQVEAKKSQIR